MRLNNLSWIVIGLAGCQPAADPPAATPLSAPMVGATEHTLVERAAQAGSVASAGDPARPPRLVLASSRQAAPRGATPEVAARIHLARHAEALGARFSSLRELALLDVADLGARGVIARLGQKVGGVDVYRGELRVLMRKDLSLVAIAGGVQSGAPERVFRRTPEEALAAALGAHTDEAVAPSDLTRVGTQDEFQRMQLVHQTIALPRPARAKRIYFPDGDRLRAAWLVELYVGRVATGGSDAFAYVVADRDLAVLSRRDLTAHDVFGYRVFAQPDADMRPLDGPIGDWTPHPTGMPDGSYPPFVAPNLITRDGFNHNPMGAADPWLTAGTMDSVGNNADAYVDRNAPDGFSNGDFRAQVTAASMFDRSYDLSAPPDSNDQAMAGIVNAFYIVNWMHDWWYDSKFDETAGNAQRDNYGRGGKANDPLHIECQDYSGRNNSDMSTPSDGMDPRMQLYLWDGPNSASLHLDPVNLDPEVGTADFGPANFNVTAPVVLVNDGSGTVTDACQAIANNVTGQIALVDRGTCTFKQKAVNVQTAGAAGLIVIDNMGGNTPPHLFDGMPNTNITIGVVSVTTAVGNQIKAALGNGAVTATLKHASAVDRDGALDNSVVAHEWGHYLHHRLADCGAQQCSAMSEGWADFNAMMMVLRGGDNLDGTYALAIYATQSLGDAGYFGIRREPYSTDMTKDGLTFKDISDGTPLPNTALADNGGPNSEVHNAGEIWATMMFEAYVALQKDAANHNPPRTFEDAHRAMGNYVVAGLKMTPPDATYTEQRDAVLAAAAAADTEDLQVMAQAFAKRGAGTCAVSPDRNSTDLTGVVESFEVKPQLVLGAVTLDDAIKSCDQDGILDAGEQGNLTVTVMNGGPAQLPASSLAVDSTTMGASFPAGKMIAVAPIDPYKSVQVKLAVALDKSIAKMGPLAITITPSSAAGCTGAAVKTLTFRSNYDEVPGSSATDNVEDPTSLWTETGDPMTGVWKIVEEMPLQHAWHGDDTGQLSDTQLVSPIVHVTAGADLQVAFRHKFRLETGTDQGFLANYDGAVIELSNDGGNTWSDVTMYGAAPPYGGAITNISGNPLADRMALVGQNKSWPGFDPVMLDFGKSLSGQAVQLRFRIGTDQAAGFEGWDIDDIAFGGIDEQPFATQIDDRGVCGPPTADGGKGAGDGSTMGGGDGSMGPDLADHSCSCALGARTRPGAGLWLATLVIGLGAIATRRRRAR